ncbi:chemerin-like receptor 2 [Spea bombifrons]|uniref:chemerin-like receptor 2 n=1 Tax=Spea bombifrons TaxID=233779 RepID=UPI0023496C11|nr:chemerin-like receptor 2 [Spea bombifrons]
MEEADQPFYSSLDVFDNYSYTYEYYDLEESPHDGEQPHVLHIVSIVIYSLAFLLGVPGNAIVIWFTGFKWDKTVSTLWFLNLAIADFIFVLFLPLHITYVATNFHWPFGKFLCKINSFIAVLNMFASVFFLTVISLDRFLFLARPSFSLTHRTLKKFTIVSGIIWILAAIIASPALYFRDTTEISKTVFICFNNFHEHDRTIILKTHTWLVMIRFFIGYLFPLLTMIICYTFLAKRMEKTTQPSNKFFWTVLAIIVAFFVCWTPYHIFSLLELKVHHSGVYQEWLRIGMPISTSLAFINSCINPILYVLISKIFRKQLGTSVAEIFKHTLRDISQTGIKSEQLMDSENNPTRCEVLDLEQIKGKI